MIYKELYEKTNGNLIWFGESEETCDLTGIVVGYNNNGCILLVAHGLGDYILTDTDIIPNLIDRENANGYILNNLSNLNK